MNSSSKRRITSDGIRLHTHEDFIKMRAAGKLVASILDQLAPLVYPGQSTEAINAFIEAQVDEAGAVSATIGYHGYRHASCISVNHVVCHGIPSAKKLNDGDILNIDVTVILNGWHGDSSRMYVAGNLNRRSERLLQVTHDALIKAIEVVRPGNYFGDIGATIQNYGEANGMSIVRDFCGHGLGQAFHAPPNVLHFGRPKTGPMLEEGMFFTIEPMLNLGGADTLILPDGWTVITRDRTLSAQYEHSIGVTKDGCEIFTLSPTERFHPTYM